jgi:adenine-specific DNA-methyltransferase
MDKIKNWGQVFTPENIVNKMFELSKKDGNILEPSSGDGAFTNEIKKKSKRQIMSIEIDEIYSCEDNIIMDFFDLSLDMEFDTIIGNPPYVAFKNITNSTLEKIRDIDFLNSFDNRSNLFLYFVRKCVEHLTENGEMIFITPREFIKLTSSIKLNKFLYENGTITDWYEYGDETLFKGYSPNVVVWRYEKNNFKRETNTLKGIKKFTINDGQIFFSHNDLSVKFGDIFSVKVGAVSGNDKVFTNELGNKNFVCSFTKKTGELKTMYYDVINEYLENNKDKLLVRKIKKFDNSNWWKWGRGFYESNVDRIYVNCKTRDQKPFFTHECKSYDGSVLAIFPKVNIDIEHMVELLNSVDWDDLGFKVGGRLCFTQKSLENTFLPENFKKFSKKIG